MSLNLSAARPIRAVSGKPLSGAQSRGSLWKQGFVFFVGLCIQFNILVGGGGEGASATGGYGYRIIDFVALGAACLAAIHALAPHRILPTAVYGLVIGVVFVAPAFSTDPRTVILTYHYILYSFAALYVVVAIDDVPTLEFFCWGLIAGLLATIPIFVIQDSVYASKLIEWGLTPGYSSVLSGIGWESGRFWAFPATRTKRVTSPRFPPPPEPISQSFAADSFGGTRVRRLNDHILLYVEPRRSARRRRHSCHSVSDNAGSGHDFTAGNHRGQSCFCW